jgi:hypothetical protein
MSVQECESLYTKHLWSGVQLDPDRIIVTNMDNVQQGPELTCAQRLSE